MKERAYSRAWAGASAAMQGLPSELGWVQAFIWAMALGPSLLFCRRMRARARARVRAEGESPELQLDCGWKGAAEGGLPGDPGWENSFIWVSTPEAQLESES